MLTYGPDFFLLNGCCVFVRVSSLFSFFFGGSCGRLSGLCCQTWSACIIIIIIVVIINQGEVWKPVDDVRGNRKHTEPYN